MPELPEVETSRRGIEPHLVGATILHAVVRNGRLRWPVSEEIYRLSDVPVLSVRRRAKYLLLELSDGWIIVHLGMSGSLRILSEELPAEKHDHVDLVMSNGKVLRYTDPRRFGLVVDQNAGRPSGTGSSWPGAAQRRVQRRLSPAKMREEENRDQTLADG